MLTFQVACAQKFKTKNDFCDASKYEMLLLICKNSRKNNTVVNTDPRPLKIQYFSFRAVLTFKNA